MLQLQKERGVFIQQYPRGKENLGIQSLPET